MKKRFKFIIYISLNFALLTPSFSGENGVFLKVPISAKAGAMGDTFVPSIDDAFSVYYNPAGIAYAKSSELSYLYHSYIQDITGNSFSFIYPTKLLSLGISYTRFSMDKEPYYDSLGYDTGKRFGFSGDIIPIVASFRIGDLAIGGTLKIYKEDIGYDNINDKAITTDFGAVYKIKNFEFSFVTQNNGGKIWDDSLVKIQRYGIAYVDNKYVLAVELKKEGDETKFDGGAEYSLLDFLKLRAGFRSAEDFGGPTFGAQINLGTFSFDYAFLSYGDLGDIHKAGITISFGEGKVREKADKKTEPAKNEVNEPVVQTKSEILWTGEENYVDGDVQPKQGND